MQGKNGSTFRFFEPDINQKLTRTLEFRIKCTKVKRNVSKNFTQ